MKTQSLEFDVAKSDSLEIVFAMFSLIVAILLAWPALVALAYIGSELFY